LFENSSLKKDVPSDMLKGTLWKIFEKSQYFGKEKYEIMIFWRIWADF